MNGPHRKGSLFVIFLTVFIDLLGFGIVLPLLPIYAKQFTLDESGWILGGLMASFSAMQFLFAPVWGRLSDRIGRRPVLLIGLSGSVIFYSMFGFAASAGSLTWIFVSRIGAGIAGATIPTAQAYIADSTTKENRTRGMALIGAAFGLGFTFGPLLAVTALLTSGDAEAGVSPWPGYSAAGLSAVALLLAIFKLPESLRPDSMPGGHRLFDLSSLREALSIPTIWALLLTSFMSVLSFANFESILAFLLKVEREKGGFGFDLVKVLLFFALLGFVHALGQGLVRRLAQKMSEPNLATLGAVMSAAGFLLLVASIGRHSLGLLLTGMFVVAVGFAFIPASLQAMISRRSDPAKQGGILGVAQSLSSLARIIGHAVSFPLFYLAASMPFWVGTVFMLLAALLVTTIVRRGRDFDEVARAEPALSSET